MKIRNILISILVTGLSIVSIGCQKPPSYVWSPRTIIITPEEVRVNDLIIMDGNVLISRSRFSWYDYKTAQKAGVPYCWPKND